MFFEKFKIIIFDGCSVIFHRESPESQKMIHYSNWSTMTLVILLPGGKNISGNILYFGNHRLATQIGIAYHFYYRINIHLHIHCKNML